MLAEVIRSGLVEARHEGAVAVIDQTGRRIAQTGDIDRVVYIRSAAKPMQAAVAVSLGFEAAPEELAVATSSHDADPIHVELVRAILDRHGLSEDDLQCPRAWPLALPARHALVRAGHRSPQRIWHNCSGKHAAMLATCVVRGWPTPTYLDPGHPLQQAISEEMVRLFGPETLPVGVDGCGAPVFRCTVGTLAQAYGAILEDPDYRSVVSSMRRFPALVSGVSNTDSTVAVALGGIAKRGAEGTLAVALPGRGAMAIKAWDGSTRAVATATWGVLDSMGWIPPGMRPSLECALVSPVLGGDDEVGSVTSAIQLEHW